MTGHFTERHDPEFLLGCLSAVTVRLEKAGIIKRRYTEMGIQNKMHCKAIHRKFFILNIKTYSQHTQICLNTIEDDLNRLQLL